MSVPFAFRAGAHKTVSTKAGSEFRTLFHITEKPRYVNPEDEETAYMSEEIIEDGKENIKEKIQSNYENSLLKNIIARFNITGDTTLLNQFQPLDPNIHKALNNVPMDSADAAQYMKNNHDEIVSKTGLPENFTNKDLEEYIKNEVKKQTEENKETTISTETMEAKPKDETTKEPKKQETEVK